MRVRHSKLLALIGAGILAVTALVACGNSDAAANTASSAEASTVAESTVAASSEAAPAEATADLSGSISMVGSTSMEKLANALSEAFMEEYPEVTVTAEFVGSGAGIEAVTNGTADIGNSSRSLKDEEKAAGVVENVVAIDGIAVCVDPANEVADLTKEPEGGKLVDEVIRTKERNQILHLCMGELHPDYREALYLTYFEGMSYRQVAEVMGKSVKQITNIMYRGKERLRGLLEREGITNAES